MGQTRQDSGINWKFNLAVTSSLCDCPHFFETKFGQWLGFGFCWCHSSRRRQSSYEWSPKKWFGQSVEVTRRMTRKKYECSIGRSNILVRLLFLDELNLHFPYTTIYNICADEKHNPTFVLLYRHSLSKLRRICNFWPTCQRFAWRYRWRGFISAKNAVNEHKTSQAADNIYISKAMRLNWICNFKTLGTVEYRYLCQTIFPRSNLIKS